MKSIRPTELRERQKEYLDMVSCGEVIFVARPKNRSVVIISENEYSALLKAKHNAEYIEKLDQSKKDIEASKGTTFTIDNLEKYVQERIN